MFITDLVYIIALIMPGYIAISIFDVKYPPIKNSFGEKSLLSLVYSLVIISTLLFIVGEDTFTITKTSKDGISIISKEIFIVVGTGIISGILLILFSELKFWLSRRYENLQWLEPGYRSVWARMNYKNRFQENRWCQVILNDGSNYIGWIKDWSYDPNEREFDFYLRETEQVGDMCNNYELEGVYIKSENISHIKYIS